LRPYLEKSHHKKELEEWLKAQGVGPEFKPQYHNKLINEIIYSQAKYKYLGFSLLLSFTFSKDS
jgi:hypothetical protein